MQFQLSQPDQIRGTQLAAEIEAATGLNVLDRYSFISPLTVEIHGDDIAPHAELIQSVISAHVPQEPEPTAMDAILSKLRDGSALSNSERDAALCFLLCGDAQ